MRKLVLLFFMSWACGEAVAQGVEGVFVEASSSNIRYVGRTVCSGSEVSFDWSGTYLEMNFVGEAVSVKVSDSGHNYYNVFVDGELSSVVDIHSQDTTIVLASGLNSKMSHTLRLQRRTEGREGITTIKGFVIQGHGAELLAKPEVRDRHIEFIGDSFTCGYGVEASPEEHFSAHTENCDLAYGAILARLFGADYTFVSNSGRGLIRNYGDKNTVSESGTMPELMMQTFNSQSSPKWDFGSSPYCPDIIVVFLGINDYSTQPKPSVREFADGYKSLIETLRSKYDSSTPILCIAPAASKEPLKAAEMMKEEVKDDRVYYISHFAEYMSHSTDVGADYHPNTKGHIKLAMLSAPYISTIMKWEIDEPLFH